MNSSNSPALPAGARTPGNLVAWFALMLVLVASCTGCATMQSSDALRKRIADLEQQNFQLRKDLTEARVRQQMHQEEGTPASSRLSAPSPGDRRGSGQFVGGTVAAPVKDDAPRVIYSEPITDASRFSADGGAAAAGGRSSPPAQLMRTARERLDGKDPAGAVTLFEQLVARYPDDSMADDAQFGVGECYFQMGKYEEAIAEYQKVVSNFPFGDKVPFAFLKIGFAHLAREQRSLALDNFKTVSEAYPGTEAATIARQQIAHLSRLSAEGSGEKPAPPKP